MIREMNNKDLSKYITPAAQEALDSAVENYKNSILEKAYNSSQESPSGNPEISLRDILEAINNESFKRKRIDYVEYKRKRFISLIALSGAVYSIAGVLIYLFQNKKFTIETDLGLIIAITGIVVSFTAFIYNQYFGIRKRLIIDYKDYKEINDINPDYKIVERWQTIEKLVSKAFDNDKIDARKRSFNMILEYLFNITDNINDKDRIKDLLNTRNMILHESYKLNESKRSNILAFADDLINKLEKITEPNTRYKT